MTKRLTCTVLATLFVVAAFLFVHAMRHPNASPNAANISDSTAVAGRSVDPRPSTEPEDREDEPEFSDSPIASRVAVGRNSLADQSLVAPVSLIPGLSGFTIPPYALRSDHPAVLLAAEEDDPKWSRGMERLVYNEFSDLIDAPISMIEAQCRSTMCGVFILAASDDLNLLQERATSNFALPLARRLGFSRASMSVARERNGTNYLAVYLRQADRSEGLSGIPRDTAP